MASFDFVFLAAAVAMPAAMGLAALKIRQAPKIGRPLRAKPAPMAVFTAGEPDFMTVMDRDVDYDIPTFIRLAAVREAEKAERIAARAAAKQERRRSEGRATRERRKAAPAAGPGAAPAQAELILPEGF